MGEEEFGFPGVAKSLRSLLDALRTLEREAEILLGRASGSSAAFGGFLDIFTSAFGALGALDVAGFAGRARGRDLGSWAKAAASLLGIADAETLDAVRDEVREMLEQVARLRERELALAGGVSQLRARAARFEEALAGLARVQGKCVARLDAQTERAHELERLAARRDDHITRLIRDTAGQRAELERVHKEIGAMRPDADADDTQTTLRRELESLRTNVTQLENGYADVKKLNVGSTQRVIETLESIRDRVSKLEARAAEMSREARAKAGRMDALARHVAAVEGRLTTAIGKDGDAIVPVTKDADRPLTAAG